MPIAPSAFSQGRARRETWMYYLPWWMQWGQALGVIAVSGLGAWIAFKQVKIATAKLNLDLYDRRFKVFEAARDLVTHVMREAQVGLGDIRSFNFGVADATFLFDTDVESYLATLRKKAIALRTKVEQLRGMDEPGERRNRLADQIAELEMDFSAEYERIVEIFKPYLKLGNI
jgi:hypothetical protein